MFGLLKKMNSKNEIISNVKIIRTKKRIKSVLTRVRNGIPEIICPYFSSQKFLENIIIKNKGWIEKKVEEDKKREHFLKQLKEGKYIFFLGKKLKIELRENNKNKLEIVKNKIFVYTSKNNKGNNEFLKKWLRDTAVRYLYERTKKMSEKTKISYKNLKIKTYKARWGSCNPNSEIFLNWKLIMLPKDIIDYVIIHELSHIIEPNHSKSFWSLVKSFDPNYKDKDKWLKINGNPIILF